ncbi:MAG: Na+/H+ antiporter NhaC [Pseudohongiellaceae bacterium]|jgi:Na+/H+ antiporter NhaC
MTIKTSTVVGLLLGLGLAAGLMLPRPERQILVAQGLGALLDDHVDEANEILADPEASPSTEQLESSLFLAALDLVQGLPRPVTVSLAISVDGETAELSAFRRAVATRLNNLNASITSSEREANPDGPKDGPLAFAVLGPEDSPGTLSVQIDVTSLDDQVELTAVAAVAGRIVTVRPAVGTDDGLAPSWSLPSSMALLPPVIAIFVALLWRKTLLALFLGILSGSVLMVIQGGEHGLFGSLAFGLRDVLTKYLHTELTETFRVEIIGFVIALVAMVGVMSRSGGVQGLIEKLVTFARTVRSTLFVTWGMGLLIFFDDYANCLLVGNTMRPLTDRLRVSREKLAYIVDSTAAPIAGISLLSTWIAFEVSTFEAHLPGAGILESGYSIFLRTIPYRFYCLFTLMFVGLTIFLGRDFGPMAKAEDRARKTGQLVRAGGTPMVSEEATRITPRDGMAHIWYYAAMPILMVLVVTLATIFVDGGGIAAWRDGTLFNIQAITQILFAGSGGKPIFIGAAAGFALAVFLAGSNAIRAAVVSGLVGASFAAQGTADWLRSTTFVQNKWDWELIGTDPKQLTAHYLGFLLAFFAAAIPVGLLFSRMTRTPSRTHLPIDDISRSSLSSVKALFFAVMILFQAWMIGAVCADLYTADYLVALLAGGEAVQWLPVLLFVAACIVAFATGSSWSTMSILLPNVVALAAAVGAETGVGSTFMVVLCIGAVLEGSIFGDHCSPISDTTVLSSVSSASDHIDHVRTQAPYALVTAGLAISVGYLPCLLIDGWSSWWSLAIGAVAIVALLLVIGRRAPEYAPETGAS